MSRYWLLAGLIGCIACGREAPRSAPAPAPTDTLLTAPSTAAPDTLLHPVPDTAQAAAPTSKTTGKPYDLTQPVDSAALRACQLLPADESRQDASLQAYLARLNRIVAARDARALLALVDTTTVSSHGGGETGKHDFARLWELHRGQASPIWPRLRRILALGGVFTQGDEGREFRLPYAQATERISCDTLDTDWYSVAVCLKPATEAHVRPSAKSAVRVRLPYSVVYIDEEQDAGNEAWVLVSDTRGQRLGYVRTDDLCLTADYKLSLIPTKAGGWRMAAYAPYD